jgi:hypothetical protein
MKKKEDYYAVAKPHAKSFQILVEKLGFVSFAGSTEDEEYKHHYARVRRFQDDAKFKSKNIPKEAAESFKRDLSYICAEPNDMQSLVYEGKIFSACKIIYHGQSYRDDIKKEDPDGQIFKIMEEQAGKGYVLTRFISESGEKDNQTFYAVFEKDNSSEESKEKIREVINDRLKESGQLLEEKEAPIPPQKKLLKAE